MFLFSTSVPKKGKITKLTKTIETLKKVAKVQQAVFVFTGMTPKQIS